MTKIFLAIPTYKHIEPDCQIEGLNRLYKNCPYPILYENRRGSPNIYLQHNNLAKVFLESDCTHYLWHDSDQAVLSPDDWVKVLVENDKDIISPLIVKKIYPHLPACITDGQYKDILKEGKPTRYEDYRAYDAPFKIRYCCGGVVLIKRKVIEAEKFPFYPEFDLNGHLMGVDISLYERSRRRGFECWINPSLKCAHYGAYPFMIEDYYSLLDEGVLK